MDVSPRPRRASLEATQTRVGVILVLCLVLLVLIFGVGYEAGRAREKVRGAPPRV